jgi:membrane protease YdiL (CAAX protease family)
MRVLIAAIVSEGVLVAFAALMQLIFAITLEWRISPLALLAGLLLTIPPILANHLLWNHAERHPSSIYHRFSQEVILPLCRQISWPIALAVALLSGICEEWFFRGALNSLCQQHLTPLASCIVTSLLFALVHFIGSFKRYGGMVPIYTAMGTYLWITHYLTDSLAAVALLHAAYNFTVILLVRRSCIQRS